MHTRIIIFLVFTFIHFYEIQGQSCPFGDNGSRCLYFVVSAKSGLIMRSSPSREGTKVITIPFGSEVWKDEFYYGPWEEIEGISHSWLRISYADKIGYVFGGFIDELEKPKYKLIIPDEGIDSEWGFMDFDTSRTWYALQQKVESGYHSFGYGNVNLSRYNFFKINLEEKIRPEAGPAKSFYPVKLKEAPQAIVSGLQKLKQDGWGLWMERELFPGQIQYTILYDEKTKESTHYTLWATGTPHLNDSNSVYPFDSISSYQVWLRKEVRKGALESQSYDFEQQCLYRGTIIANKFTHTLAPFKVFFMGEIDGDGKLDLIIGNPNRGFHYQLYLSKEAQKGFLLKMVAEHLDFGC